MLRSCGAAAVCISVHPEHCALCSFSFHVMSIITEFACIGVLSKSIERERDSQEIYMVEISALRSSKLLDLGKFACNVFVCIQKYLTRWTLGT